MHYFPSLHNLQLRAQHLTTSYLVTSYSLVMEFLVSFNYTEDKYPFKILQNTFYDIIGTLKQRVVRDSVHGFVVNWSLMG